MLEKLKTSPNFLSHIKPQHQTLKISVHLVDGAPMKEERKLVSTSHIKYSQMSVTDGCHQ